MRSCCLIDCCHSELEYLLPVAFGQVELGHMARNGCTSTLPTPPLPHADAKMRHLPTAISQMHKMHMKIIKGKWKVEKKKKTNTNCCTRHFSWRERTTLKRWLGLPPGRTTGAHLLRNVPRGASSKFVVFRLDISLMCAAQGPRHWNPSQVWAKRNTKHSHPHPQPQPHSHRPIWVQSLPKSARELFALFAAAWLSSAAMGKRAQWRFGSKGLLPLSSGSPHLTMGPNWDCLELLLISALNRNGANQKL